MGLSKSGVSSVQADPRNALARTTTTAFRQDSLFTNPSFEGTTPPKFNRGPFSFILPAGWERCNSHVPDLLPGLDQGRGSTLVPADGNAYLGLHTANGHIKSFAQRLRVPLKAGVTYTFLVDVAYARNYDRGFPWTEVPITLRVEGGLRVCGSSSPPLWSKVIPTDRTTWRTDTVTVTPTVTVTHLLFSITGTSSPAYGPGGVLTETTTGAVLVDNLRTIPSLGLQKVNGTAQAAGKAFRLLWQPVLSVGGLDSLTRPQLKGTLRTFRGGRVPLPANLQVTTGRGFYFLQEAAPAAGQDTLYYGLYVRNMPLANGAKDDTLRHLYQCRRTFGSQAGLLGGSLAPLTLGSPPTAQRVTPAQEATLAPDAATAPLSRRPIAPRRRPAPPVAPQPALSAQQQRAR